MNDELSRRLRANEQRRRAEAGRPLRANFVARFQRATGVRLEPAEFLSVEESDELIEGAARARPEVADATWYGLSPLVFGGLASLADAVGDARFYLSAAGSDAMGIVRVPVAPLLRHLESFWMPLDEDIILVSEHSYDGLWLLWDDHWVELKSWGWIHELLHGQA